MDSTTAERAASQYDFIIIGAGAAGVCAAIDAAEGGLKVLVLEAFPEYGGAAATSGGGTCIAGTPLQESLGISDSPELALSDWKAWGGEQADLEWARYYLERGVEDIFLWAQARGVEWDYVDPNEGNSVPRWHHPKGGGAGLMKCLYESAQSLPITWRFSCPVTRLIVENGAVTGVEVEANGQLERISARAVLVATGGYANSPEMLQRFVPDMGPGGRLLLGGSEHALGRGHKLLEDVGAQFVNLDIVWMYPYGTPDYKDPQQRRGLAIRGVKNEIWINAQGRRFHNEVKRGGWTGTQALLAQSPKTCWSVFDRAEADLLTIADPYYRSQGVPKRDKIEEFLAESPFVHSADTLEGLANAVGLPAEEFVRTVTQFNDWVRNGMKTDPDFGRDLTKVRPIEKPPFFALQYLPMARKCFGGVKTDLQCHVLRPDGSIIPGLLAAGEVAGMAGGHINGRAGLEGTMIGPSLFSGRVAGRTAVAELSAVPAR